MGNKEIIKKAIDAVADLEGIQNDIIYSVEHFRFELERVSLMSDAIDEFIENYMRFDNN